MEISLRLPCISTRIGAVTTLVKILGLTLTVTAARFGVYMYSINKLWHFSFQTNYAIT